MFEHNPRLRIVRNLYLYRADHAAGNDYIRRR